MFGTREARLAESVRQRAVAQDKVRNGEGDAAQGLKALKSLGVSSQAGGKCLGLWEFLSGQTTGFAEWR